MDVTKREVRQQLYHRGVTGQFVYEKYFLRKADQFGEFTSLSHPEAVEVVTELLAFSEIRDAVARELPKVVARTGYEIL
jgi:hypothetical protein